MALQTYLENVRRGEYLAAHWTFLAFPTLVDGEVLVQVGFLCEALVAALIGALERPLACVHTQVVEEVVPLTEVHLAASVLAEEYLYVALGAWVFELVDREFSRRGDLLVDLDLAEVEGGAQFHTDLGTFRHFVSDLGVLNLVFGDEDSFWLLVATLGQLVHEAHGALSLRPVVQDLLLVLA